MDSTIESISARKFLIHAAPTVEVEVILADGSWAAPRSLGASTGVHEALELRDGDKKRYGGKGVLKAVANVNDLISDALFGWDACEQKAIDAELLSLDGTPTSRSWAQMRCWASPGGGQGRGQLARPAALPLIGGVYAHVLPVPMMNILNGGAHTAWQSTDMQEFMVMPFGAPSFAEAALGFRDLPGAQVRAKGKGYITLEATRAATPGAQGQHEAIEVILAAIEKPVSRPAAARMWPSRSTRPPPNYTRRHQDLQPAQEGKKLTGEQMVEFWPNGSRITRLSRSKTAGAG